jgi:LAS superfamily LD-carboxypeptidase LdcB
MGLGSKVSGWLGFDSGGGDALSNMAFAQSLQAQQQQQAIQEARARLTDGVNAAYSDDKINSTVGEYEKKAVQQGNTELSRRLSDWVQTADQSLAERGMIGSSQQMNAHQAALADYLSGKTKVATAAIEARERMAANLRNQRAVMRDQIASGYRTSDSSIAGFQSDVANLQEAERNIVPNAIGDILANTAGGAVSGIKTGNQASLNQNMSDSLSALKSKAPSASGNIV